MPRFYMKQSFNGPVSVELRSSVGPRRRVLVRARSTYYCKSSVIVCAYVEGFEDVRTTIGRTLEHDSVMIQPCKHYSQPLLFWLKDHTRPAISSRRRV